jgi:GT2 family glycosyltransferase
MKRVGIVILNWQRPASVVHCLASLRALDYPAHDVVVVDNNPRHDLRQLIASGFPRVTLIENGRNLGFAGGCNVGMAYLLERGADYVFLLNDDAEVSASLLTKLVDAAESDPRIGILGPTIYYCKPRNMIWSAGGSLTRNGQPGHVREDQVVDDVESGINDVDYVSGCGLLVRREVIRRIGGLDERFFAYFEETEWCTRAKHAGFRVVVVPHAQMWHNIAPGERNASALYLYLMARNRLLYLRCSGASRRTILSAASDMLRGSLRRHDGHAMAAASLLTRGMFDFFRGRYGRPPVDII